LHRFPDQRGLWPRWSPDGQAIALTINQTATPQSLALIDVASREVKSASAPHSYDQLSSVAWEPGSRRFYCVQAESVSANSGGSPAALFRYSLSSGRFEKLLWSSFASRVLDWMPSGELVLDTRSSRINLKELRLGTNQASARSLTFGNSTDRQPAYSPHEGEQVLFSSNRSGNLEIWSIDRKTKALRRLTDHPADDWDPGLSPSGKHLLWSSNRSPDGRKGNLEIWIAEPDGANPNQLTHDGFAAENPVVTPDDKWVVYSSGNPGKTGIWKTHLDGTAPAQLVKATSANLPEISPDGRYVAYLEGQFGLRPTIKVVEVDSGAAVPFAISVQTVKETSAILGRLRWMPPDGKAIAFLGQDPNGVNGVYVQDFVPGVDTSNTRRQLAGFDPENSAESFGISPDGHFITAAWEQFYSIMMTQDLPR
jgi:TolB protein